MIIFDNKQIYELVHVSNLNKLMSLFLYQNPSVSLLQWQVDDRSLQWASWLVSLLQWHSSLMQWLIYSHHSTYQWINLSTCSHATSESASMTSILNAMIYSLSSFYSSVNLIICSHATSESATMMSSKLISSMSKSISESASMTLSMW